LEPSTDELRDRGESRIAAAWEGRALELAAWVEATLLNRSDCYGGHYVDREGKHKRYTAKARPDRGRLAIHFAADSVDDIIGLHATSHEETCLWIVVDVDAHPGDGADPAANLAFAMHVHDRARAAGLAVRLVDSNGKGGYHVWIVFDTPIPCAAAWLLGKWLVHDFADFGLATMPESNPKSPKLSGLRYGNWVRLPGRHHKRPHWSKVWCPRRQRWLAGRSAIVSLLALRGKHVEVDAIVPAEFAETLASRPRPRRQAERRAGGPRPDDPDENRDLSLARDALRFYSNDELHYDDWFEILLALRQFEDPGRDLFHDWSATCDKYDPDDLERHWDSARGGDDEPTGCGRWVTVATLFKRASDAGWPGPFALGLHYQIDIGSRGGPVFIVRGRAAFAALDSRGHSVVGLPDRDEPCLRKVTRLLGEAARQVVVIGGSGPHRDPAPVARSLERLTGRRVKAQEIPAGFADVPTWLEAADAKRTEEES
jgi:hypothetical protein